MKRKSPKVIELSNSFKLPEDAKEVIFTTDIHICSSKKLIISIEKCSVGHSFYILDVRMVYFKGLNYIIQDIPADSLVYSKGVSSKTYANSLFFKNGSKDFMISNKTNWLALFPEKYDDEKSENAGKDLYLLKNTDYRSLTPPVFEKIFNNVLNYCETMEFYEICADLIKFSKDWFIFYEKQFEKQPLLQVTQGWGWLYFLNNKTKYNSVIEKTK